MSFAKDMELTENDIILMKKLSAERMVGDDATTDQSVLSIADSASNFADHVPDEELEDRNDESMKISDEDQGKDDESRSRTSGRNFSSFIFDRERIDDPELPKNTVKILSYPFDAPDPSNLDNLCNLDEYRQSFTDAKVYLVGTAHFSLDSQKDVLKTIENVQPDLIMVELCPSRISVLTMDEETLLEEAKNLTRQKIMTVIKQNGVIEGIMHVLLLSMSAHITKELGMAPGSEFRAAYEGNQRVKGCRLILGDRPIQVTLQRTMHALNMWQRMRLFWHIIRSSNKSISKDDVERCKQHDLLEELLREMAGEYPEITRIMVHERDLYMANGLRSLLKNATIAKRAAMNLTTKWQPVVVVAVVGIGHMPGIVDNWTKTINVTDLLSVPERSHLSKYTSVALKGALLGIGVYFCYRLGVYVLKYF